METNYTNAPDTDIDSQQASSSTTATRSSARVRAKKQSTTKVQSSSSTSLAIHEPVSDPKGKKRAAADPDDSSELSDPPSLSESESKHPFKPSKLAPPAKKKLRPSTSHPTPTTSKPAKSKATKRTNMNRKHKATSSSAASSSSRPKTRAAKGKAATAAVSSSRDLRDDDVEMLDVEMHSDSDDEEYDDHQHSDQDQIMASPTSRRTTHPADHDSDDEDDDGDDEDEDASLSFLAAAAAASTSEPTAPTSASSAPQPPQPSDSPNRDDSGPGDDAAAAAMALFSSDFRSLGQHLLNQSARLKGYLQAIKPTADPAVRYNALQELNELLVMSNEDTLSGYFQVDAFVRELVGILGGKPQKDDEDDGDENEGGGDEEDEDAQLAAVLAMSAGGAPLSGDSNPDAQVLASRCLQNLMDALPGSAHTIVYHGAIPALCSKLTEIQFIDLAEQNISTLNKICEECAGSVARQGGLPALLGFLDFFNTSVQRTALTAAAACCRNATPDIFSTIKASLPTIRNVLSYPDQRLVESASLCVIRIIESYSRTAPDMLEQLLTDDEGSLVRAINILLLPPGGSPAVITPSTYTLFLRALSNAAKASPKTTLALLEADIASTIYQILTGVLPSSNEDGSQGLADMAVMQNLAHRPKEQVEEVLSLVNELLPPLPRDGVFDQRSYTEKSLSRMIKHKTKAERAAAKQAAKAAAAASETISGAEDTSSTTTTAAADGTTEATEPSRASSPRPVTDSAASAPTPSGSKTISASSAAAQARIALLKTKPELITRFMRLIVPVLVEVFAASVALNVRTRSLTGLLKACSFEERDGLWKVVENIPLASFIGSMLSTRDQHNLGIAALQLVELLLMKLPTEYMAAFRREGVLHEIDEIAKLDLTTKAKPDPSPAVTASEVATEGSTSPGPEDGISFTLNSSSFPVPPIPVPVAISAPSRRTSSIPTDPQDILILRARIIRFKYLSSPASSAGTSLDPTHEALKTAVTGLGNVDSTEEDARQALSIVSNLFGKTESALSSFELLNSGLVDAILEFATVKDRKLDISTRQELLIKALISRSSEGTASPANHTALAMLVKRLQESLTRMESFEVVTVSPSGDDSRRNSASLLARQLRLRLTGEGPDIPRSCNNITVSIHAIATFQALHDYLRPRVSNTSSTPTARLSGMLAAFAAAAGLPPGSLSRPSSSSTPRPAMTPGTSSAPAAASSSSAPRQPEVMAASASSPNIPTANEGGKKKKRGSTTDEPRRSRRLSQKQQPSSFEAAEASMSGEAEPSASGEAGPSSFNGEGGPSTSSSPTESSTLAQVLASAFAGGPLPMTPGGGDHPDFGGLGGFGMDEGDDDDEDGYIDAEVDADMFDEDEGDHPSTSEKTVNVAIAEDGNKIVAQTPDGTRVATPNPLRTASQSDASPAPRASYANAVKAPSTDWHLEFFIDNVPISLDTTIYGAVHQHEFRRSSKPAAYLGAIWSGVHTIKFKKVPGPAPLSQGGDLLDRAASPPISAAPDNSPHLKILRLLRVLHKLNADAQEKIAFHTPGATLPESAFINNKLTAKLTRQLEEPMIVASACLPDWAIELPQHYPFLFPFNTRFAFLQSTSFGYARLILKWQTQQSRSGDSSRRDDAFGYLGRLQRQKVRISRKHLLESAIKVLELYGSSSSILEVEYFEEVGTGLGPTLEFYSLVSKEFARRNIKMWHDADVNVSGSYVHHPTGLFPAPFAISEMVAEQKTGSSKKRSDLFRVLGQFVGKALLDSRIIDMSFNKIFLKLILNLEVPKTIDSLRGIDPDLAKSLSQIQEYVEAQRQIEADDSLDAESRAAKIASIEVNGARLEHLSLDFTVPGYDIELLPNGKDVAVEQSNVESYIERILDTFLGNGVQVAVSAFREGFSKVFPITDLQAFSADEVLNIFGKPNEDWSYDTLAEALKADHGFNADSRQFRELVEVMSSYDVSARRDFLQFMTGSPKLPIGGFRGLTPPLTVVRKPHEAPLSADDYLPSVMTCVNYLKLPAYTTKDILAAKLYTAMKEGVGSFHLS